jgi:hypothetical protein
LMGPSPSRGGQHGDRAGAEKQKSGRFG